MKQMGDNDKLIGLAFDMPCGCTIRVLDIIAAVDAYKPEWSEILVKVEIVSHCEKAHRETVVGNIYYQEYSRFHSDIHPSYSKQPEINTIKTMQGKKSSE